MTQRIREFHIPTETGTTLRQSPMVGWGEEVQFCTQQNILIYGTSHSYDKFVLLSYGTTYFFFCRMNSFFETYQVENQAQKQNGLHTDNRAKTRQIQYLDLGQKAVQFVETKVTLCFGFHQFSAHSVCEVDRFSSGSSFLGWSCEAWKPLLQWHNLDIWVVPLTWI